MEHKKKGAPIIHKVGDVVYDVKRKVRGVIRKVDPNDSFLRYFVRYKDGTLRWTNGSEWGVKKQTPKAGSAGAQPADEANVETAIAPA
jgi:hypothetical protein